MGAHISGRDRQSKRRSNEIDEMLNEDKERLARECQILLLGKSAVHNNSPLYS
jgi:hypothetical protein